MTERVDLNDAVNSAISLISPMIQKSTSRFYVDYGAQLPILHGNLHRLEQVVINLIQNACQSLTSTQQAIHVTTGADVQRRHLFLIVEDEGRGIPEESLPFITDAFFTTKYETGGVGLGLSIISKIVEEHDGKIKFHSQVGKGTRVRVDLPIGTDFQNSERSLK